MATKTLEQEVAQLKRRVKLLESEVRIFTPPLVELERGLMEFRTEVNQRFTESRAEMIYHFQRIDERFQEINQRTDGRFQKVDERLNTIDKRLNTIDRKLDEIVAVMKEALSRD